jgi:hypothetical protein
MISLRRNLMARRNTRLVVWWASSVGMAIGLLCALEGVWVAALPLVAGAAEAMWLVGVWVLPRTRDAYFRRLTRIWRSWASETQWCDVEGTRKYAKFLQGLRALAPPDELRGGHEKLLSLAEERDRLVHQRPRTASLMVEMTVAQRAAREAKERLLAESTLQAHRPFAGALERLFATTQEGYVQVAARAEAATERMLREVERMTPPSAVVTEHALLTAGLREHLDVMRRFHSASRAADPRGVEAAATEWERSVASLRDLVARAGERLWYDQQRRPE